jgi:N-methylhydantoinase B
MESTFILEADKMDLCQIGEYYRTMPGPAVAGGRTPPNFSKQVFYRANGVEEEGGGLFYILNRDETLACHCMGGCGVGDPAEREIEDVKKDVMNEIISLDSARDIYGVVIDPKTFEVDKTATEKLRSEKKSGN